MNPRRNALLAIGAALCWPLVSHAQQKVYRIGFLTNGTALGRLPFFLQCLREHGYAEGRNLSIVRRIAAGDPERLNAFAADLAEQKVDVIFAFGTESVLAAKRATNTIPIVFPTAGDPVGSGLVASLARPGGNVTGVSNITPELTEKRLQMLREAFPTAKRIAVVMTPDPIAQLQYAALQRVAANPGLELTTVRITSQADAETEIPRLQKWRPDAVFVAESALNTSNRSHIVQVAAKLRLPAMYATSEYVEAGGLLSYGADRDEMFRRAASHVDRILKGAKPGDLPVERATKFQLWVNMKTAKALGITLPQSILLAADRVIE